MVSPTDAILVRCAEVGFFASGVCAAAASSHRRHVHAWLSAGRHGEMSYLAENLEQRLDPGAFVPGARSLVVVADRYCDGRRDRLGRPLFGRVARYARGQDYHRVLRERLEIVRDECRNRWPEHRFRACVDTAPVLEREHAARAGIGAIGKHTLLLIPGLGSWVVLGAIVTTMPLEATRAPAAATLPGVGGGALPQWGEEGAGAARGAGTTDGVDPCGACTRCIDACPTKCITPWSVDASACISYLTLEHRGAIDPGYHAALGDWLAGCDVCQEVCPHSAPTRRARRATSRPEYAPIRDGLDVLQILDFSEADRKALVDDSALERLLLPMLQRNAIIVAANTCPPPQRTALIQKLEQIAVDAGRDHVVRSTAATTIARLRAAQNEGSREE